MNQPAISVIVPIYNVEPWLCACVDSLLCQSFSDFELILVDDGSPDSCGKICDEYAKKDSRVRVIHQANGGLSVARNSGISAAKGGYLAFVDSDDFVHPDYLKRLYEACQTTGADMAVCAFETANEDGTLPQPPAVTRSAATGVFEGKQLLRQFCTPGHLYYTIACNKLYSAALWQTLRFPAGLIHEDDAVAPHLFWACNKAACIDDSLLYYRQRDGSIVRSGLKPSSFDGVSMRASWCHFFIEHEQPASVVDTLVAQAWRRYLWCSYQAQQVPLSWSLAERWQLAQRQMQALLPLAMRCPALSAREKLSCLRWGKKKLPVPTKADPTSL